MASVTPATQKPRLFNISANHGFRALRARNYRLYWMGQLVSLTGTWMQTTAQAWLVLQLTGSPLALGTVTALQFVPVMLLSLWTGVLADRINRYRLVLGAQVAALLVAAIFGALVALGLIQLWQIYLLAFCSGLINALNQPAQQAFAVELVQRDDRSSAVALNSALIHGARIVGPALAGAMFEPLGVASIVWVNAFSFLALIGAVHEQ
jgi:MFS family permease